MTLVTKRRLMTRALGGTVAFLGVALIGFFAWGRPHMERMSGGHPPPGFVCTSCHLRSSSPHAYARGVAYPSPAGMALGTDGETLYVACEETGEIAVLATKRRWVERTFPVGSLPHGVALDPDGRRLYVSLRGEDRVAAVDVETGLETASVAVGRTPCGLDLSPDGSTLVVANSISDDVSVIDAPSMTERSRLAAGREPYAVAIDGDGRRAFVTNRLSNLHRFREVPSAELTVIDLDHGRVERRYPVQSTHLSEGVAVSPEGGLALISMARVRNLVPIVQVSQGWVMTSGIGVLSPLDGSVRQFPLDEVNAYFADPSGVAIDDGRKRAYVASGGSDRVTVLDLARLEELAAGCEGDGPGRWADHLGVSSEYVVKRIAVGANPRKLLLSPDGGRLYVAEHLNDAVAIVDTDSLEVIGRVSLAGPRDRGQVRRGEILFHNASITFQGQFSCRSCHPDGHVDGLTYDFGINGLGRNILDNRSLLGIAETAPFKWNGKNKDLHQQCGPRFAMVLTMADPFAPEDLDDLVAYINSLPPPLRPGGPDRELTEAEERGKAIFGRDRTNDGKEIPVEHRCSTCHLPPFFTNRTISTVKTQAPTDSSGDFDTPHLVGIAHSAPYLHDGRAMTLEEIWTVHSPGDTHGVVNDLSKAQLNDLVEYLKGL